MIKAERKKVVQRSKTRERGGEGEGERGRDGWDKRPLMTRAPFFILHEWAGGNPK